MKMKKWAMAATLASLSALATHAAYAGWQEMMEKARATYTEFTAPVGASGKILACFSSEKKDAQDYVPAEIKRLQPEIDLELYFTGSGELIQDLKDGNRRGCSLVSPASRLVSLGAPGYTPEAKSLGATPMILVLKAKAAAEIEKILGRPISFSDIPVFGGQIWKKYAPESGMRGIIKIGITQPRLSNSGLVAGVTFLHNHLNKYEPLEPVDVDEASEPLKAFWIKTSHTQTSTSALGDDFASDSGTLTGIVTYESELPRLVASMANKGGVKVYYPDPGIMNDHPIWVPENAPNKKGAEAVLAYLLSQDGQNAMAKKLYIRPSNPKARIEFSPEVAPQVLMDVGPVDVPTDPKVVSTILEYFN